MKTSTAFPIASLVLRASAAPLDISTGRVTLQLNIDLNQDAFNGANAFAGAGADQLFAFSSMHFIEATPDQVVNGTELTGGLAGATGQFNYGINVDANMICYNISLNNFQGEFDSPATTATHIHEAARGASGPPRIAFPNPEPVDGDQAVRNSAGCLKGPFTTGVLVDGVDSGEGFHVSKIEEDPAAFMTDVHSSLALPGAVRGQLA
ncbi:hypothetical protein N0V83_000571 [Neocucurbitaria cava]|uniref:CHRD domain-containing protein n=1 Tax=Neocucurbitaria cava TaxID=798079 RepID=A0A9W8YI37_9PLEO|nr:hypothetical protein N0V83_000571 [Neocucurbitaria cava]